MAIVERSDLPFLGYVAVIQLSRLLPRSLRFAFCRGLAQQLGRAWCRLDRAGAARTHRNLELLLGHQLSADQQARTVRQIHQTVAFGKLLNDLLPGLSLEDLNRFVRLEGAEHLDQALRAGKGVVLLGAHFGLHGYAQAVYLTRLGYPLIGVLGEEVDPHDSWVYRHWVDPVRRRCRHHLELINPTGRPQRALQGALAQQRILFILAEVVDPEVCRLTPPHALPAPLLDQTMRLKTGPMRLARWMGAPVLTCFLAPCSQGFTLRIDPPLALRSEGTTESLVADLAGYTSRFEPHLRHWPHLWAQWRCAELAELVHPREAIRPLDAPPRPLLAPTLDRRRERALSALGPVPGQARAERRPMLFTKLYYHLKPLLPVRLRAMLRRWHARSLLLSRARDWPIKESAGRRPDRWPGWPEGHPFALVLTHDVEGPKGLGRIRQLAEMELELGFRSSFNLIPEGSYRVPSDLRRWLVDRGFEVGVHDLHHDGKLYSSREGFRRKARRINYYLKEWNAVGFRSGFMLRRLDWLYDLAIQYDASTFDVDPFEPQPDGADTIFPFWRPAHWPRPQHNGEPFASNSSMLLEPQAAECGTQAYVELPYTLPQDSTLLLVLGEQTNAIWKRKLDWIAERGGMALVNVHPDYLHFTPQRTPGEMEFPAGVYHDFLDYAKRRYGSQFWAAVPRQVADYVRAHNQDPVPGLERALDAR